jgi:hypothetical protein
VGVWIVSLVETESRPPPPKRAELAPRAGYGRAKKNFFELTFLCHCRETRDAPRRGPERDNFEIAQQKEEQMKQTFLFCWGGAGVAPYEDMSGIAQLVVERALAGQNLQRMNQMGGGLGERVRLC